MRCTQETNVAWALIDAVKPKLTAAERKHVFVILGAGDTFLAIRLLLKMIGTKQIMLRPHLVRQCSTWLDTYMLHEEYDSLRCLIEGLLIGDAVLCADARREVATIVNARAVRDKANWRKGQESVVNARAG